ncbi:multidrug resistance protein fnx1 [Kwoniella heveanensis CBS 569]|nr:multidrug resistance protein fnx1 [Kwoniella heveanensis CBS 569]
MTVFGSGSMIGGPTAGWLTDRYGWHYSFWVQLPIVFFCAVIVSLFLPTAPIPPTHKSLLSGLASLDWLGSFFLISSTFSLILGLSFHTSYLEPWSSPIVWGLILCSVFTAAAFVYTETKVERPVVPLHLFKSNHIAAIMVSGFFLSIGNQAFMFQIPVYFAVIMNTSAAQAGLIMSLCGGLGLATGSMVAGQYIRAGHSWRWLGPISLVPPIIGGVVATYWTPGWPWWSYYATVLPCVLGYSTFLCVQLVALISSVDSQMMPKATALMYTSRSLGATLGVSIGGSVQLGALASSLKKQLGGADNSSQIISAILHSKAAIRLLPPALRIKALYSYAHSLSVVWIFSSVIATITFICSFWIQSRNVHDHDHDHDHKRKRQKQDLEEEAAGKKQLKKRVEGTGAGVVDEPFGDGLGEASVQVQGER